MSYARQLKINMVNNMDFSLYALREWIIPNNQDTPQFYKYIIPEVLYLPCAKYAVQYLLPYK